MKWVPNSRDPSHSTNYDPIRLLKGKAMELDEKMKQLGDIEYQHQSTGVYSNEDRLLGSGKKSRGGRMIDREKRKKGRRSKKRNKRRKGKKNRKRKRKNKGKKGKKGKKRKGKRKKSRGNKKRKSKNKGDRGINGDRTTHVCGISVSFYGKEDPSLTDSDRNLANTTAAEIFHHVKKTAKHAKWPGYIIWVTIPADCHLGKILKSVANSGGVKNNSVGLWP